MSFHAISLTAPILKAFHIRSPPGVNSKLCSALKLGIFFNFFRAIFLSFMKNTLTVVPLTGLSLRGSACLEPSKYHEFRCSDVWRRLSSDIKSCRKYPYCCIVLKNHISQLQFPDDFQHLGGPLRDCCCYNNPPRLILGTPFYWLDGLLLWQPWVALGLREQRTNLDYTTVQQVSLRGEF